MKIHHGVNLGSEKTADKWGDGLRAAAAENAQKETDDPVMDSDTPSAPTKAHSDSWDRENRIEALRAASRIVGGASFGGKITINDGEKGTDRFTTALAEYFVGYIEKGER